MVQNDLVARGIGDPRILDAFRSIPRERFIPERLVLSAYEDRALPIEEGQTISQPYVVALMYEALGLDGDERVLEVGTGSGYAAAILSKLAREVHTIERHAELAHTAERRLAELGIRNVQIHVGDGSLGLPEHAPFDAIVVAAGGHQVPPALVEQLAVGGRLLIPVHEEEDCQRLRRVTRVSADQFEEEEFDQVCFVPLIGSQGWASEEHRRLLITDADTNGSSPRTVAQLLREVGEPIDAIEHGDVGATVERIARSRVVLIGEATHGTSEFYRMRARITRELIERRGFRFVAVEADWPDAFAVNRYVQDMPEAGTPAEPPFTRFPQWMWRNEEVAAFVEWLRDHNRRHPDRKVGFYGLDMYSLYTSIRSVLEYLDRIDPAVGALARARYSCLWPWEGIPERYGHAALTGRYRVCESDVVAMLREIASRRIEYAGRDGVHFFDAMQNAKLVANAEKYYRAMYRGSVDSWNLRDRHMFETLQSLLAHHGVDSRAVVWEHNSHVGDASATEMSVRGESNVGELCRRAFGGDAYLIGFGTDHGTVAAASNWDEPMAVMTVRPSNPDSHECIFHESGVPAMCVGLRDPARPEVHEELATSRLERAIGVVYRPATERQSHYFDAELSRQFDEFIWFDRTNAVEPVAASRVLPAGHPFGGVR
jgi:protein-L-isoaspartate(D-aspartate) O-methyltransferase